MSKKNSKNIEQYTKNKKQKKKKRRVLKVFLTIIVIFALFALGFVGYSAYKNGWGLQGMMQTALGQDETTLANLDPFTVLIMGVSEDISAQLTDTIIIASYNPKTQKATLLSIPRDTYVGKNKNKADSYDKINALYQTSPETTLAAVNKITGLSIEYYIIISNNALVELVDEIGGVEFDVPIDMDYDDSSQDLYIHLEAGLQTLTGEQAEWLVRFRHNNDGTTYPSEYGDNDLGRMKTQQEFLKAVVAQTLQLKNITKIGSLVDILQRNVTTNIEDWSALKDYIPYAMEFSTENIETATLPGTTDTYNGLSFFVYDEDETEELVSTLFREQNSSGDESENEDNTTVNTLTTNSSTNSTTNSTSTASSTNSNIKIELLNGSGDSTVLTSATNALKKAGYSIYKTGTTTTTTKTTIVNKTGISSSELNNIKEILGTGNLSSSTSSSSTVDVTIILGKDY